MQGLQCSKVFSNSLGSGRKEDETVSLPCAVLNFSSKVISLTYSTITTHYMAICYYIVSWKLHVKCWQTISHCTTSSWHFRRGSIINLCSRWDKILLDLVGAVTILRIWCNLKQLVHVSAYLILSSYLARHKYPQSIMEPLRRFMTLEPTIAWALFLWRNF